MDQIFDRFERMFKSWLAGDDLDYGDSGGSRGRSYRSGDSDFNAAMDELDDFLARDRTETEARERIKARREAEERERSASGRSQSGASGRGGSSGPPPEIVLAYRTLGLPYGTPFPQVKTAYKKLLMQNHPDRNSATPEQLKHSTAISAQINSAYQRIETWVSTGRVAE